MWLRVARSRIGHAACLVGSVPGRIVLLCLALSGCMTLGDQMPPPASPASDTFPADVDGTQPASLMMPEPAVPSHANPRKAAHSAAPDSRAAREKPAEKQAVEKPAPPEKQAAAINPDRLIGLNPEGVEKLMGTPSKVKDDHLSREWVYASPGCNFRVFFYPNLNAASFRALKYGGSDNNGGTLAASNACVRRILTARANAAD